MSEGILSDEDLASLPAPAAVEELDYEVLLSECKEELQERMPQLNMEILPESDPINKILEVLAYRELLVRQSINEAIRGSYLALARGNDLATLGSLMKKEKKKEKDDKDDKDEGQPGAHQKRVPSVFNTIHTAGSEQAYIHFARQFTSCWVKDVAVYMNGIGKVIITLLPKMWGLREEKVLENETRIGIVNIQNEDKRSWTEILKKSDVKGMDRDQIVDLLSDKNDWDRVIKEQSHAGKTWEEFIERWRKYAEKKFQRHSLRPITHKVEVKLADITHYEVKAEIGLDNKPGNEQVLDAALTAVREYTEKCYQLGLPVHKSGLLAAIQQPGVRYISLVSPEGDVQAKAQGANFCPYIDIKVNKDVPSCEVTGLELKPSGQNKQTYVLSFKKVENETLLTHYVIYWGDKNNRKLEHSYPVATLPVGRVCGSDKEIKGSDCEYRYYEFENFIMPAGATGLLVYTANENGEALEGVAVEPNPKPEGSK